jgi:hypothetical protein
MIWLLENELFDNLDEIKEAIVSEGHQYITAKYVPFGGAIEIQDKLKSSINFEELETLDDEQVFAYGSLQFIQAARWAKVRGLSVNHWCNLPQLRCSYYYPHLGKYLLNRECAFLPFGKLADSTEWIFKTFGSNNGTRIFMRPDSGFKEFTGQVYDIQYWDGFLRLSNIALKPEDLVVISSPKNILKEFRVVIGPTPDEERQRIVTLCRTHCEGKLSECENLLDWDCYRVVDFVHRVLSDVCFEPDPMWVMDVAMTDDLHFHVLEINSMSCSGYYKCDKRAIVRAVHNYLKIYENPS